MNNQLLMKLLGALPEIATLGEQAYETVKGNDTGAQKINALADDAITLIKDGLSLFVPSK